MKFLHKGLLLTLFLCLAGAALAFDDIDRQRDCQICGMDRKAYGYSRMVVTYDDGAQTGTCSLSCAVTDMLSKKAKQIKSLQVADRNQSVLIEAETAVWVVGGSKSGVMTAVPKWAFSDKAGADKFVKDYGGEIVPWPEVLLKAKAEIE